MPFKWDAASERNLLLFAISTMGAPSTAIWDQVADKIEPGSTLNGNACSQKFYKLKKESEKLIAEGGGSAIGTDAATPVKTPKSGGKGTGSRKRQIAEADADGETATPTKRRASKKAAAPEPEVKTEEAPTVKAEDSTSARAD